MNALIFLALIQNASMPGRIAGCQDGYCFPETDDLIDSYMFNQQEIIPSIPASFGDYATVDDLDFACYVGTYFCWGVTTGAAPTSLDFLVVEDAYGTPSGAPVFQEPCDSFVYDSGYTFAGYTVWLVEMHPQQSIDCCWIGSQRNDGVNWYILCGTTVSGSEAFRTQAAGWAWSPLSSSLEPGDIFKIIITEWGTPWWTSLARRSWASIKYSFPEGQ